MTTKTIKQIFPLLCVLACLAYGLDAQIINEFPNGAVTLNSAQTISGVKNFTATPTLQCGTEPTPLASQKYVDMTAAGLEELLQQGNFRLYYVTATDSVTGARLLATYPELVDSSIVYPGLSSANYVQVNPLGRLSSVGEPGVETLVAGEYQAVRYMSSDQAISTGRSVTGVNELWLVDADGSSNPTFVASSGEYIVLGTEIQRITTSYKLSSDVSTGGTTRRFLEKHYRKRTGILTGANPVVTVYYGGIREGVFTAPLSSAIVMRTDASNAKLPDARANLDVYSKAESRQYTDTLATAAALAYHPRLGSTTLVFSIATPTSDTNATNKATLDFVAATDWKKQSFQQRDSWINTASLSTSLYANPLYEYASGSFIALSGKGVYKSTDNGITWTLKYTVAEANAISITSTAPGVFFIGSRTSNADIYRSDDYGETWVSVLATTYNGIWSIKAIGSGTIIAGVEPVSGATSSYIISTDDGGTWGIKTFPIAENISGIAIFDAGDGVIFAASQLSGNVFRSDDYAQTWTTVFTVPGVSERAVMGFRKVGGVILMATGYDFGRVYRSTDNGLTWSLALETNVARAAVLKLSETEAICTTLNNITYYTSDKGATWATVSAAIGYPMAMAINNEYLMILSASPTVNVRHFYNTACTAGVRNFLATPYEVIIATTTDAGDYKLQVNGNAWVNGNIQGAFIASDTSAGRTQTMTIDGHELIFKDGILTGYTAP